MPDTIDEEILSEKIKQTLKKKNRYLLHISLFIITFITTTLAGVFWISGKDGPYEIDMLLKGLPYSISIMLIITFHEFGHYFAAKHHRVDATLPFYIPFPPMPYFINFGTMGAVIKTRSRIYSRKAMFDIGVAGPLAGFVACLAILIYGFTHVPDIHYLLKIHPDYLQPDFGKGELSLVFGDSILFHVLRLIFSDPSKFFPPMSEVYHYPYLCVGWFGLLITSMNMIPVGQLDGGHISYTMFGSEKSFKISAIAFICLFIFGVVGIVDAFMELGLNVGWGGWLFWSLVLYFIIKLKHPPVPDPVPLGKGRMIIGYISFMIFIISFSPSPLQFAV